MAEFVTIAFVTAGLLSPIALMIWLTRARKRAQAKVAADSQNEPARVQFATEDNVGVVDGLQNTRQQLADHDLVPPDNSGGEFGAIRALQGRR